MPSPACLARTILAWILKLFRGGTRSFLLVVHKPYSFRGVEAGGLWIHTWIHGQFVSGHAKVEGALDLSQVADTRSSITSPEITLRETCTRSSMDNPMGYAQAA